MDKLLKQFYEEYNFLYDNHDRVAGFREAVAWFDENYTKEPVKTILCDFNKLRMDVISSDREAAAFAFAVTELGLV